MLVIIEVVAVAFVLLRVENIFSNTEAGYILKKENFFTKNLLNVSEKGMRN